MNAKKAKIIRASVKRIDKFYRESGLGLIDVNQATKTAKKKYYAKHSLGWFKSSGVSKLVIERKLEKI